MEKENKILSLASKLIQAKISPNEFKKEIMKIIDTNNVNLYMIIEDFDLFDDSRTMLRISDLKNAINNFIEDKWSMEELEEWSWNVNGLNIIEKNEDTIEFLQNCLFLLENIKINELDKEQITDLSFKIKMYEN